LLIAAGRADGQQPADRLPNLRSGWLVSMDMEGRWIDRLPSLSPPQSTLVDGRVLGTAKLPSTGSAFLLGVNSSIGFTVNDRWVFPLLGIGLGWAAGPHPKVWLWEGELPIEMKPWTLRTISLSLPGVGVRFKHRRWSFQATINPSARVYWMGATAGSASLVNLVPTASSLSIAGQLETCRRFDPTNRGCLVFAPTLYEQRFGNGGAIALRWEFGP
jgi:hypothetical protein